MRLAKHLAHAGVASRRAAEAMIAAGRVTVDGATITDPARDVTGAEAIAVDGAAVGGPPALVVYAVHKPAGVVSTARDTHGRPTVGEPALRRLRDGVDLEDGRTAPAQARRLRSDVVELTIREGRKRQVRRLCGAVGHPVLALRHVGFGPLPPG